MIFAAVVQDLPYYTTEVNLYKDEHSGAQGIHYSPPPDSIAELIFHDRFFNSHSVLPLPSTFGHFLYTKYPFKSACRDKFLGMMFHCSLVCMSCSYLNQARTSNGLYCSWKNPCLVKTFNQFGSICFPFALFMVSFLILWFNFGNQSFF